MNRPRLVTACLLAAAPLVLSGCLVPPVEPLGAQVDRESLAEDEQHLWKQARESTYQLDRSGLRLDAPALDAYLQKVAVALVGDQLSAAGLEPRVRVIANPDMNAFSFPTGDVYIHTALLARMDNEAQLATVLAREYAHVIERHGLRKHRTDRNTANLLAASGLALSGVQGGGNAKLLMQVASASSIGGYAYAMEMIADARSLEMMDRVGYDLNEAPRLFETTVAYQEEVHAQQPVSPLPFAMTTPVHVTNRINAYRKLLAGEYAASANAPDRVKNEAIFRRAVLPAAVRQAALELDRGRFDSAEITITRAIETDDANPDAWLILGEARERSNSKPDRLAAIDAYEQALLLDRNHARAHRALGILYYRDGKKTGSLGDRSAEARDHLARYLDALPDAPDAGHVRAYLADLDARATGKRADTTAGGGR